MNDTPTYDHLTPTQRRIVAVLSRTVPRKGSWVAEKLDMRYEGSIRNMLATLVRCGAVSKVKGGGYLLV